MPSLEELLGGLILDKLDLTDDQLSLLQHNLNNEDVDLSDIEELWEKD